MGNKYDVIIVGAGPGGIFSAYELVQKAPNLKVNGIKLRKSHITEMWCGIFFAINY